MKSKRSTSHECLPLATDDVGRLACSMAHEIGNSVMGVLNYAQLVKDRAKGNTELAAFADEIIAEVRRVATLTRSLLECSPPDDQEAFEPVSPSVLMASVLVSAREESRLHGIEIFSRVPANLPLVSCRPRRVGKLITALLTNAREALEEKRMGPAEKKQIFVTAHAVSMNDDADRSKRAVCWTVCDNGSGFPTEPRNPICKSFFTTKDRSRHAGLGLWMCCRIAREHGGQLHVESKPGQWTRVQVHLPLTGPEPR